MALAVQQAVEDREHLIVEAGTGTGKTLAYLIPILASGKTMVVSTGTRQLQDQLLRQEVPHLRRILDKTLRVTVLKGRNNYLCPHRLLASIQLGNDPDLQQELLRVQAWHQQTATGDLGELIALDEPSAIVPLVTSTAENCLGQRCPQFAGCPVYKARKDAETADLIIVNHHLLFADLALKEETTGQVLPTVDVVVVDECHQISSLLPSFLGRSVSSRQLVEVGRDATRVLRLAGEVDVLVSAGARGIEQTVNELVEAFCELEGSPASVIFRDPIVVNLVGRADAELAELAHALERYRLQNTELLHCYERLLKLVDLFALMSEPVDTESAQMQWLESRNNSFVIRVAPVSMARDFRKWLATDDSTWIFTSATVTTNQDFTFFQSELGLGEVRTLCCESPFCYPEQAALLIPDGLPEPAAPEHTESLVSFCLPLLEANPGRCFFLVTSYAAMNKVARLLATKAVGTVCVQGSLPRDMLLSKFRTTDRAILVATHSFWEGVDVKGSGLTLLVIDKLPFQNPSDPLVAVRDQAARRQNLDPFEYYTLPKAMITLRQGFGRLIREETDQGLFVLGDVRVLSRSYGKAVLRTLPEMPVLRSTEAALQYLARIPLPGVPAK